MQTFTLEYPSLSFKVVPLLKIVGAENQNSGGRYSYFEGGEFVKKNMKK